MAVTQLGNETTTVYQDGSELVFERIFEAPRELVWKALTEIPAGETRTYGEIARQIGEPKSARAVGRACATNQAAVVIPCHRAVGSSGALTGYRWGVARKERLLAEERRRSSR